MSAHTVNRELGEAVRLGFAIGRNPGSGGTLDLEGKSDIGFTLSVGTYKLPNATVFTTVTILATGVVTLRTVGSSSTVASIANGTILTLIATSGTTWAPLAVEPGLPVTKYTTSSTATTVTPGSGELSGAQHVYWENTANGTLALTTRTAAQLFADVPGQVAGDRYLLTIVNRGDNTITITGGDDVTITGENTIATLVTRTYVVELDGPADVTMTSVSKGTIET